MKTLNLFPIFLESIEDETKTSSIRVGHKDFTVGEKVKLTCKWNPYDQNEPSLHDRVVEITDVIYDKLDNVMWKCENSSLLDNDPKLLSLVYHRTVTVLDEVTLIKWRYV